MDLISIITNAASGLNVCRAQVATASNNIANSDTPGYARQEAIATDTTPAIEAGTNSYVGRGVTLQGVVQKRDQFVETQINTAYANSANTSAQSDALSTVTALDSQTKGGITDALGDFYSALRDLNQNPSDQSLRQAVVDKTQAVSTAFNGTATSLASARTGLDANVTSLVNKVNGLLTETADLNGKITLAVNSGRTPNDLLDVRQNDIDQLAQLIGARPVSDDRSGVSLVLPGGSCLVSGSTAVTLSVQSDSSNRGHTNVVYTPVDGSPSVALTSSELGGQLGGSISARDDILGKAETNVDTLAYDFATTVNTQSEAGYALDGSTGNDLFAAPTSVTGAASDLAVDPTVYDNPSLIAAAGSSTAGSGDSTNLQAVIATETTKLSNDLNVQDGMAKVTSDFGVSVSTVNDSSEFDKNLLTDLTKARDSASGVSEDDEMVKLIQAQNVYNALSKVVTITNEMLDTLMKMI
jgi:flagellar hook-associated protein 1 FlgK